MNPFLFALLALLSLCRLPAFAQLIIDKGIYKVNFSNTMHVPRYVSYYLYKGGGTCDREKMNFSFKNDTPEALCAKDADYNFKKWGYQKGHLANAEDFAMSCKKEELTFRYYNCLPQTDDANHHHWLHWEGEIREWSKKEKLYIITGGYFKGKKTGKNKDIAVPEWCWKVVQSVKTKKVLFCAIFTNTKVSEMTELSVTELGKKLHSRIILLK
jgi:DNA/RNA endonuclease G (NUC1)